MVESKIDQLNDHLRLATEALLVTISSRERPTQEEIKEWVRESLA